jgi:hypothetical protein
MARIPRMPLPPDTESPDAIRRDLYLTLVYRNLQTYGIEELKLIHDLEDSASNESNLT